MILQTTIFNDDIFLEYEQNNLPYSFIDLSDITFRGGLNEPIHSWFRLTPSYSPELVRYFIKYFNIKSNELILDPFLGKGTTLIETQKNELNSIGVEINPLLSLVSEKSLKWNYDIRKLDTLYKQIRKDILLNEEYIENIKFDDFLQKYSLTIPSIHNPFRWWKRDVLKKLLFIKYLIGRLPKGLLDPFWIALSVVCLDCANIHRNHPTISFDDNHTRNIKPFVDYFDKMEEIINDLKETKPNGIVKSDIVLGDSTDLGRYLDSKKVDYIITSPPYPNRFSYIHTTRPQLFFLDIISDAKMATDIDLKAIGGTWGKATSNLQKKPLEINNDIKDIIFPIAESISKQSLLMSNYAINYFNMMHNHVKSLRKVINIKFKGTYVVGNSRLVGNDVYTDILLSKIFQREGYSVDDIKIFRKRGGKKALYETAVCVSLGY